MIAALLRDGLERRVVRSPLSVPDSAVNRPTKYTASGARGLFGQGIGQDKSHQQAF
jgi:hypothetical protein